MLPRDTLRYHLETRPLTVSMDRSSVLCAQVALAINRFMGSSGYLSTLYSVDCDAVAFYLLNHATAEIRRRKKMDEPLASFGPVVEEYFDAASFIAVRMFYYLLLICTREARHHNALCPGVEGPGTNAGYGAAREFLDSIRHEHEDAAVSRLREHPPACTVGEYADALCALYFKGKWGGSFGGKAWGGVAAALRDFVRGIISPETMVDLSFSLCHNTGPIFNKGMIYEQQSSEFIKILDVQRAGQIPQLVDSQGVAAASNAAIKKMYGVAADLLGDCMAGEVDWVGVMSHGAVGSYYDEIKVLAPADAPPGAQVAMGLVGPGAIVKKKERSDAA